MKKGKLVILLATATVIAGGVIIASQKQNIFLMALNQESNLALERSIWLI